MIKVVYIGITATFVIYNTYQMFNYFNLILLLSGLTIYFLEQFIVDYSLLFSQYVHQNHNFLMLEDNLVEHWGKSKRFFQSCMAWMVQTNIGKRILNFALRTTLKFKKFLKKNNGDLIRLLLKYDNDYYNFKVDKKKKIAVIELIRNNSKYHYCLPITRGQIEKSKGFGPDAFQSRYNVDGVIYTKPKMFPILISSKLEDGTEINYQNINGIKMELKRKEE